MAFAHLRLVHGCTIRMVQEDAQALEHILPIKADLCQTLLQQFESIDVQFQVGGA